MNKAPRPPSQGARLDFRSACGRKLLAESPRSTRRVEERLRQLEDDQSENRAAPSLVERYFQSGGPRRRAEPMTELPDRPPTIYLGDGFFHLLGFGLTVSELHSN